MTLLHSSIMDFSMQDMIPWSLIYSAQNDKHKSEIASKDKEIIQERIKSHQFACFAVRNLLDSCSFEFCKEDSEVWIQFKAVIAIICEADIDDALDKMLLELGAENNISGHQSAGNRATIMKQFIM